MMDIYVQLYLNVCAYTTEGSIKTLKGLIGKERQLEIDDSSWAA